MSKPIGRPDEHPDKDHVFAGTARFSSVSRMTAMLALGLRPKFFLRAGMRYEADASILPQALVA